MRRYHYNPYVPPEKAAPRIVKIIKQMFTDQYGVSPELEVIYQDDYLAQGREHCKTAAFTVISDIGGLVGISLTNPLFSFQRSLGYWSEPWDETELCFYPTEDKHHEKFKTRAKTYKRTVNAACQKDFDRAQVILANLPIVPFDLGGMHQFTWIRMRDFVNYKGKITREAVIDSEPHLIEDLEDALEAIRELRCVANVWYNLD